MKFEFQNETCSTCAFFKEAERDVSGGPNVRKEGDCRRYPPIFKEQRGFSREEYIKVTRTTPACGEYREQPFQPRKEES